VRHRANSCQAILTVALLTEAGIEGPYVLVGHSFGGLYMQTYAARYPD